jgi:hypothetical protein
MPRAQRTAHDYRDPSSFRSKWRERCIILPEEIVEQLFLWHGGQSSAAYALASTGMRELVSLSMIDAAVSELERVKRGWGRSRVTKENMDARNAVEALLGDLSSVRHFWKEHSAKEAGMDVEKYEYDQADYGLTAKVEDEIDVHSG